MPLEVLPVGGPTDLPASRLLDQKERLATQGWVCAQASSSRAFCWVKISLFSSFWPIMGVSPIRMAGSMAWHCSRALSALAMETLAMVLPRKYPGS